MWTDLLTPVRWLYRGVLFLILLLVLTPPTVALQGKVGRSIRIGARGLDERVLNAWSRVGCRVFGIQPAFRGKILDGPVLVVANHVSWLDIQVLHSVAAMSFVAKAEIQDWPLMGWLASRGGTVYHRRGSHDSASGAVEQVHAKLAGGGRVAIFPEGGIFPGEHIKRFHARMFRVAVEADCPIQPAMVRYIRDGRRDPEVAWIKGESLFANMLRLMGRPTSRADLTFMESFEPNGRARRELADRAQAMVEEAYAG